jgi:hypothetical protein
MRRNIVLAALAVSLAGCTSLPQMSDWTNPGQGLLPQVNTTGSTTYQVRVESNPAGAAVTGGGASCTAPCMVSLNGPATLELALAGYVTAVVDVRPPERMSPTDEIPADPRIVSVALDPAPPPPPKPARQPRPKRT